MDTSDAEEFLWAGLDLAPLFSCCCAQAQDGWRLSPSTRDTIADLLHDEQQPQNVLLEVRPLLRPWLDGVVQVGFETGFAFPPEDADRRRALFVSTHVEPTIQAAFDAHPALQSAVLAIAQYWDDQANDEVHLRLVYSERESPDLDQEDAWWGHADPVNLPTVGTMPHVTHLGHYDLRFVPLFAAFCTEDAHQNAEPWTIFTPYALFRRDGDGLHTEVVGRRIRPWLDARKSADADKHAEPGETDQLGEADDDWLRTSPPDGLL